MHTARCLTPLFVAALILVASRYTLGQASSSISVGGVVGTSFTNGGLPGLAIEPFTASWKTTRKQRRADGVVITHVSSVIAARDSVGRTYQETHPEVPDGTAPSSPDVFFVFEGDPLREVTITWNSASKEAVVFHLPSSLQVRPNQPEHPAVPGSQTNPPPPPPPPDSPVERLGPKTIHGIEAKGTRFSTVIPPGTASDKPVTVIEESWYSLDSGVEVLHILNDPRTGISRTELASFERGAPDPILFEVPSEYTVRDVYPEKDSARQPQ